MCQGERGRETSDRRFDFVISCMVWVWILVGWMHIHTDMRVWRRGKGGMTPQVDDD